MIPIETEVARIQNTLLIDLLRFVPELLLIFGIAVTLFAKFFRVFARVNAVPFATALVTLALGITLSDWMSTDIFRGLLRLDLFANFFRALLLLAAALTLILTRITALPDAEDSADFATLILGGTLGMMLMVSANHLLMVFLAIEMASLPSYVLAGFHKGKVQASESALKYVVFGAAASGILLYGLSLLVGQYGTASLTEISTRITIAHSQDTFTLPLATALIMIALGLGFKLALVPVHFWLPDVFEGATAEIAAFLAVASKAAAFGLFLRLAYTLLANFPIVHIRESAGVLIGTVAILTATYGNLVALVQSNVQRLLAYSTIAHAGIMVMGAACMNVPAISAILFYLVGYLPMTLGAFATVAILRRAAGSTSIESLRGLLKRSPALGISFIVFLFGLLGLPPLAGFAGKYQIFAALYGTGEDYTRNGHLWLGQFLWVVLAAGIVNTVIGAAYYLKVLKAVALDEPETLDQKGNVVALGESFAARAYLAVLALAVLAIGLAWDPILEFIGTAAYGMNR